MPVVFFEELIHAYSLGAVINIGVGDGALALACVRNKIPYTGFCLTEEHKARVTTRLQGLLMQGALTHGDRLFAPQLAKDLAGAYTLPDSVAGAVSTPVRKRPHAMPMASGMSKPSTEAKRSRTQCMAREEEDSGKDDSLYAETLVMGGRSPPPEST